MGTNILESPSDELLDLVWSRFSDRIPFTAWRTFSVLTSPVTNVMRGDTPAEYKHADVAAAVVQLVADGALVRVAPRYRHQSGEARYVKVYEHDPELAKVENTDSVRYQDVQDVRDLYDQSR